MPSSSPLAPTGVLAAVLAATGAELSDSLRGNQGLWATLSQCAASYGQAGASWHFVLAVRAEHHATVLAALPRVLGRPAGQVWPQALPTGFHRLVLGRCRLTFCVGDVCASIAQWHLQASQIWVCASGLTADSLPGLWRSLSRRCAPQARLYWHAPTPVAPTDGPGLAGFVPDGSSPLQWVYRPRWPVPPVPAAPQKHALVIGAGLAGASACASLTQRGWHVTLLDAATGPARGASGLPVGLMSEHHTTQPTVLSRLSRSGVALHERTLQQHIPEGQGWCATQVLQTNGADGDDSRDTDHGEHSNAVAPHISLPATTVRPAVLVQTWLGLAQSTGRLTCLWNSPVARLVFCRDSGHWQAWGDRGALLAEVPHCVVAAAHGSAALLDMAADLRPVKGQLSFGPLEGQPLAPHALRHQGVYVPCHEDSTHPIAPRLWTMGSTYERGVSDTTVTEHGHDRNAASLAHTLLSGHELFVQQRTQGTLRGWAQVRCASTDRLPLVGAVPAAGPLPPHTPLAKVQRAPGLWALCAMGSRGLTLAGLAAELLTAQMNHEPWPVETELGQALDPARFALKRARKKQ